MADPDTTDGDGLHCVYGKCQGIPHGPFPCNPGCHFQGSANPLPTKFEDWADLYGWKS